jgi:site-specific recombinase XerD
MTELAARRSSGRLLRRRYSEHNRRRMEKHRSLPTLPPMSQQHAWELPQKLAGRAGLLEGSGGHATMPPYVLRHSCTTVAFDKGVGRT